MKMKMNIILLKINVMIKIIWTNRKPLFVNINNIRIVKYNKNQKIK